MCKVLATFWCEGFSGVVTLVANSEGDGIGVVIIAKNEGIVGGDRG